MEVMIDLETLDTSPNSVIATIGAVKFDRYNISDNIDDYQTFYRKINLKSCEEIGLTTSEETLKWSGITSAVFGLVLIWFIKG